jgi:glycine/D-amino acid oxidase-like deaminating enzyme
LHSNQKIDSIIIGQGLAGSCLAMQLIQRGKKVLVFDEPHKNKSTSVAAGLFNPVSGKWMLKAWQADEIFPYLHEFYLSTEKQVGEKFFNPMPLYIPFLSVEEQNAWMGRSADISISNYVQQVATTSLFGDQVRDPFGGVLLSNCGYVETGVFTKAIREFLQAKDSYRSEEFDLQKLEIDEDLITYSGVSASQIIFCQGTRAMENKYFRWLPFKPLKGETMDVQLKKNPKQIFNRGVYLVPGKDHGYCRVGATYNRITTEGNSEGGLAELRQKLDELLRLPYEIVDQHWGIRPAIDDRKPVLGAHPDHKNVLIFNGLGTKGVSLAPYFSCHFADWMEGKINLNKEVNINRYKSLYSKSLG